MGLADKAKDKAEELAGKAKGTVGDKTDNPDLEAEGRMQESKADLKQAGRMSRTPAMTWRMPSVRPAAPRRVTTTGRCGSPFPR